MSQEVHIYLIPGMGADRRLFEPLDIKKGNLHYLEWKHVPEAKSMRDYATHLCKSIETENNIYIGISLGGMMAREMALVKKPLDLVLLSAPASTKEFPPALKMASLLKLGRWFGPRTTFRLNKFADIFMGFSSQEDRAVFYDMMNGIEPEFIHFAINAILEWDTKERPSTYYQVVGSNDRLFKTKRMLQPSIINGAGHFMTFERPDEISNHVNRRIGQLIETME